jgi:hypothetical protein
MTTETDLAWLAGIIDGEGAVRIRQAKQRNGSYRPQPCIAVAMTHYETVQRCYDLTKMGSMCEPKQKPGNKDQLRWTAVSRQALAVAKMVVPYAVTKRAELQMIIDHYGQEATI